MGLWLSSRAKYVQAAILFASSGLTILCRARKETKSYVVIELKKNQTSDDTIGQLTRYMGWIMDKKGDKNVSGIVIAADYDSKLEYALKVLRDVQVFSYKVSFLLEEFKGKQ